MANTHYVSREDFAADLHDLDDTLADAEIDQRYESFLDDLEHLQNVQARELRRLIRETGCRSVFVEGVTDANLEWFHARADELRETDFDELERRLKEAEDVAEAALLIVEIDNLRAIRLQLGAVGQPLVAGEPIDVLPLEDAETFTAANPVRADGSVQFDEAANQRREDAMARRLMEAGPVVIVILGRDHDLGPEITAANRRARYRRVEAE